MRIVALIPARYQSSRFPGKPLVDILGKPMIQHVYEQTCKATLPQQVLVATDDVRIKEAVEQFGGQVVMTSATHQSGTDRLAEVVAAMDIDLCVNVQGDEPLIHPAMIDAAIEPLLGDSPFSMATLKYRITSQEELDNPDIVKVVTDDQGKALYFSRYPIPFNRSVAGAKIISPEKTTYFKHVGLYVYKKELLLKIKTWLPSATEQAECLEQFRVLEHGYAIKVVETKYQSWGVDRPDDLKIIKEKLELKH